MSLASAVSALATRVATEIKSIDATRVGAAPAFNVRSYGAVGDGTTDDTTSIQAAITAAHVAGGTVYFPVGNYKTTAPLNVTLVGVSLIGAGAGAAVLQPAFVGDCIRWTMTSAFDPENDCGTIQGFTIDGTNGASGCGLHYGDAMNGTIRDLEVRNYSSGTGIWVDNRTHWTEGTLWSRIHTTSCHIGMLWDVNGGDTSMGYQRIKQLRIVVGLTGDIGFQVQNGAKIYNGEVNILGNCVGTAIKVIGITNYGGTSIANCMLCIQVEQGSPHGAVGLDVSEYGTFSGTGVVDFSSGTLMSYDRAPHPGNINVSGWVRMPGLMDQGASSMLAGAIALQETPSTAWPYNEGLFAEAGGHIYLAGAGGPGSGGQVVLRPQGTTHSGGQAVFDTSGRLSLSGSLLPGPWAATTGYLVGDVVLVGGLLYQCVAAHTSGSTFTGIGTNWAGVGTFGAWQTPTFASGWAAVAGYDPPRFRMELGGTQVHIIGSAGGTNATTMFTLPAGYRPLTGCLRSTLVSSGMGYISIDTSGVVFPVTMTGSAAGVFMDFTIPLN